METYQIKTIAFAPNDELILRSLLLLGGARLEQRWRVDSNAEDPDALFTMPSAREQPDNNLAARSKGSVRVESKYVPHPKDPNEWLLVFPFRIDVLIATLNRVGTIADERSRIDRILNGEWLRSQ